VHLRDICTMKARSRVFDWGSEDPSMLKSASYIRLKICNYHRPQMLNNGCLCGEKCVGENKK
jgi:hypothetical protein